MKNKIIYKNKKKLNYLIKNEFNNLFNIFF